MSKRSSKHYSKRQRKRSYSSDEETTSSSDTLESQLEQDVDPIEHEVKYRIQSHNNSNLMRLSEFLNNPNMINKSGDPTTKIIDRMTGRCYNISDRVIPRFFKLLNNCIQQDTPLMYAEKQQEFSGLMLDFDIKQNNESRQFDDEDIKRFIASVIQLLIKILNFTDRKTEIYVAVTKKPSVAYKTDEEYFKDGFHILFPSILINKPTKLFILNQIIKNEIIDQCFSDIQCNSNNVKDIFDTHSAHVPVFFVGCATKKGNSPYKLSYIYKYTLYSDGSSPISEKVSRKFKRSNIQYELSLNYSNDKGIIKKSQYTVKKKYLDQVAEFEKKSASYDVTLRRNFSEISTLGIHDHQSQEVKALLDILKPARYNHYTLWYKVMLALSNIGISYKPLAEYFSRKSKKFNQAEFEDQWDKIVVSSKNSSSSIGSLYYWAKKDNPEKFEEIRKKTVYQTLYSMIINDYREGILGHADIGEILYKLLAFKYRVDKPEGARKYSWYEFMLEDDKHQLGELYKWVEIGEEPISLSHYISYKLPHLCSKALDSLKKSYEQTDEPGLQKWYTNVIKNTKKTIRNMSMSNFKAGIIKECRFLFMERNFANNLDQDPLIRGTANGVLQLSKNPSIGPTLITGVHNHLVSRFTKADFIPFDPYDKMTKELLITLRNLFPDHKHDSFLFTMCYLATTLDGNPKESMFMIMKGNGSNGKSTLSELHKNAIGDYIVKMPTGVLFDRKKSKDGATPSLMLLQDATLAYYSESDIGDTLISSRIKELTGSETIAARALHKDMINFRPKCHHWVMTNNDLTIDTEDYGTWRRIVYNPLEIKFVNPTDEVYDEDNPYQRLANPNVQDKWTENPEILGRYLGIMTYYWTRLQHEFRGKVKYIPHKHIEIETAKYRMRENITEEFLNSHYIKTADKTLQFSLDKEIQKYQLWYKATQGKDVQLKGLREKFLDSKISKHIKKTKRGLYIVGHRFLARGEELNIEEGDTYAFSGNAELEEPEDNFGIVKETPMEWYERLCDTFDTKYKHLFKNNQDYDVDITTDEYQTIGGSDFKTSTMMNLPEPVEERTNNLCIDNKIYSSGIVLKELDEPQNVVNQKSFDELAVSLMDKLGRTLGYETDSESDSEDTDVSSGSESEEETEEETDSNEDSSDSERSSHDINSFISEGSWDFADE